MSPQFHTQHIALAAITPHPDNPRRHSKAQIKRIADSITAFGFRVPVVVDAQRRLICGHARVEAARLLKMESVPALLADDLDDAQVRAFMIADNRLSELSEWDDQILAEQLKFLTEQDLEFDIETIGFDWGDIEHRVLALDDEQEHDSSADEIPDEPDVPIVTRPGDLWLCGDGDHAHRILCADCTEPASYTRVLAEHEAALVFTDPPYNLPASTIGGVCAADHGNFEMAAGEMSPDEFTAFLGTVMDRLIEHSEPGSIHYLCMDWRHAREMLEAGQVRYAELKNLCVWAKDRPGMGTFYRSQHELVFVFKRGPKDAPHRNHFGLGEHGRTRSNVWRHPSARSFDATDGDPASREALTLHPTIKPVRLIEDALLDCSRRGDIVLDPFLGSGSTLIACEKAKRVCAGIELAPRYVDVAITRWQRWTGRDAIHPESGRTFEEIAADRTNANDETAKEAARG